MLSVKKTFLLRLDFVIIIDMQYSSKKQIISLVLCIQNKRAIITGKYHFDTIFLTLFMYPFQNKL